MHSLEIPVHQTVAGRASTFDLRIPQVLAGRDGPGNIDDLPGARIELWSEPVERRRENLVERRRLQRRHRHALAIDRIEAADGIPDHEIAGGIAMHAFV